MTRPAVIVIVGAGPRGVGVLERLVANLPEMLPSRGVHIHVVDPYPPGAGRLWRTEQSPLMWVNVTSSDITMFTDESVRCDGPVRPGPPLDEWMASSGEHTDSGHSTYATRRVQGNYLKWFFDRIMADLPADLSISVHSTRATQLSSGPHGKQLLWLAGQRTPLLVDTTILALGHLDCSPDAETRYFMDFAGKHGLGYVPRTYPADTDLSMLKPGETVLVRGAGLVFVDLMVLLTEGRGGTYLDRDGDLHYVPSGSEPRLYIGSRRGVPYRTKFSYGLIGEKAPLPRFFDASSLSPESLQDGDFHARLWPLMAKEIGWSYYHQLFNAHPDRVTASWSDFSLAYSDFDWNSGRLAQHIEKCVPDASDRLDLASLDRPLKGATIESFEELQHRVRAHVRTDIEHRSDPFFSADLGAYMGFQSVAGQLRSILSDGLLAVRSEIDATGWWKGFFEYFCSGPPRPRARQLLALSHAGIVNFIGAGMWVAADDDLGAFRGGGANVDHTVYATALIDARLPQVDLRNCTDLLLRSLFSDGGATEYVRVDEDSFVHRSGLVHVSSDDFRMIDHLGRPCPRRYAVGPFTSARYFTTFTRPGINGLSFRQNDILARSVLDELR